MEELHPNVKMYTHSGCKPAQMAAQGEIPIGLASAACAQPYIQRRAPIKLIIPAEGTGWDLEASALVKGG
jgi:iron(III) transport system substrate-binding protein